MVGFFTTRLSQKFLIHALNQWIFMALPQHRRLILIVQCFGPQCFQVPKVSYLRRLGRLATAVDTAARAGHDFHEIILFLAAFDPFQHGSCIANPTDTADPNFLSDKLILCFLDALVRSTNVLEYRVGQRFSGQYLRCVRKAASMTPPVTPKI